MKQITLWLLIAIFIFLPACEKEDEDSEDSHCCGQLIENDDESEVDDGSSLHECFEADGEAPTSQYSTPTFSAEYYARQSSMYFDTLDSYADPDSIPNYSALVARWEWPPWLKLTGFGKKSLIAIDKVLRLYPTAVSERDCRGFDEQPFGRCHVVFYYNEGDACPIYEEFTFNNRGEITFIEAWSDLPEYFPTPDFGDYWAEGADVYRLSTLVPGLGTPSGRIDLQGDCMKIVAEENRDVADFLDHAKKPVISWIRDYIAFGRDSFEVGCGWQ